MRDMIGQFLQNRSAYNKHLPFILTSGSDDDDLTDSDDSEDGDDTEDDNDTEGEDDDERSGHVDEVGHNYFGRAIQRANLPF
jgi:hypothetical protein